MTEPKQQIGRIAFRVEGDTWHAYYAMPDTMHDAIPLATIKMSLIVSNERVKELFMETMREALKQLFLEKLGQVPDYKVRPAPFWEKRD